MPPTPETSPSCDITPIRSGTCSRLRLPRSRTGPTSRRLADDPFPPEFVDQIVAELLRDRGRRDLQRLLRAFESLLKFPHQPQDAGLVRPGLAAFGVHPDRPVVARDRLSVSFPRGESVGFPYIRIGHFFRIHGCPPPIPDGNFPGGKSATWRLFLPLDADSSKRFPKKARGISSRIPGTWGYSWPST